MASLASSALAILVLIMYVALASCKDRSSTTLRAHVGPDSLDEEWGYHFGAHPYYSRAPFSLEGRSFVNIEATSRPQSSNIDASSLERRPTANMISSHLRRHGKKLAHLTKASCSLVPYKNYLIGPITFSGPCQSNIFMQIKGSIKASGDQSNYKDDGGRQWILFKNVANLVVDGGGSGKINGNGKIWCQNSCKVDESLPCKSVPTAMTFYGCNNSRVQNLKIQDAQQMHTSFEKCNNLNVSCIKVTAPGDSPNTERIHVTSTHNIHISSCVIGTDDCISIVDGLEKGYATNIICGPGHGIRIGSLGSGNSAAYVSGVKVDGAKLIGTTNGVRIKTWQGGLGSGSHITFKNSEMQKVSNPIIIDQNYCDQAQPCKTQNSAVQVKDVFYKKIRGTSTTDVAIRFSCSESVPCRGITLQDVSMGTANGATAGASCDNVNIIDIGNISPLCPS